MADRVTIVLASDDAAETRDCSFTVDDYDKRTDPDVYGDLDAYLDQRAYPKLRAEWRPDFHEVSRHVERGVISVG
jgi:hypothetical protein